MSGMFSVMDVSASALQAQRRRMDLLITNIANAQTTRTPEGGPYKRKDLVFESQPVDSFSAILADLTGRDSTLEGVRINEIIEDPTPAELRYEPNHPDANEEGFVAYPNVKPLEEMANLLSAVRSFELNTRAFEAVKEIVKRSIDLGRS